MEKLRHEDLWPLEDYRQRRQAFRREVMSHKKDRRLPIGEHACLYFEDAMTIRYQVQEMLRIERIEDEEGIADELSAYNPLIPDGRNWKATLMMEYEDENERRQALGRLLGIEQHVWLRVADQPLVRPIANEDLERTSEDKTAAVHFLRLELNVAMIQALQAGASLAAGIDHPLYTHEVSPVPEPLRLSLLQDLSPAESASSDAENV